MEDSDRLQPLHERLGICPEAWDDLFGKVCWMSWRTYAVTPPCPPPPAHRIPEGELEENDLAAYWGHFVNWAMGWGFELAIPAKWLVGTGFNIACTPKLQLNNPKWSYWACDGVPSMSVWTDIFDCLLDYGMGLFPPPPPVDPWYDHEHPAFELIVRHRWLATLEFAERYEAFEDPDFADLVPTSCRSKPAPIDLAKERVELPVFADSCLSSQRLDAQKHVKEGSPSIDISGVWPIPEGCYPPATSGLEPMFTIDRGENFHGPLIERFYLCYSNDYDPEYVAAWLSLSGSQMEDDCPRLVLAGLLSTSDAESWSPNAPLEWSEQVFSFMTRVLGDYLRLTEDAERDMAESGYGLSEHSLDRMWLKASEDESAKK